MPACKVMYARRAFLLLLLSAALVITVTAQQSPANRLPVSARRYNRNWHPQRSVAHPNNRFRPNHERNYHADHTYHRDPVRPRVPRAGLGRKCSPPSVVCRNQLVCRGRKNTRVCMRRLRPGRVCGVNPNTFCPKGLRCRRKGRRLKCVKVVRVGSICNAPDRVCAAKHACQWRHSAGVWNKRCVHRASRRGTCNLREYAECAPGLRCFAARRLCMRPAPVPFTDFINFNRRRFVTDRITIDLECRRKDVRTYSGYCNNLRHPMWGTANSTFWSKARPVVHDFATMPNARVISNTLCAEPSASAPNSRGMSELVTFFGQFIDHTITFTDNSKDTLSIPIPAGDVFRPGKIPFFRTVKRDSIPVNFMSSYIDGVNVYGRTDDIAIALREHKLGRLRLVDNVLPREGKGVASPFSSGDTRVNENPVLTSLHTVFAREHNRVAAEIVQAFPTMSDDGIYELARSIVIAQMQAILYYEWLPAVTGRLLPRYRGYRPNLRASVSNEFSTVAFRVGHTLVNSNITCVDSRGVETQELLREAFFNPTLFTKHGAEAFLRGAMQTAAAEVDSRVTDDLRIALVGEHRGGLQLDLAALNIQRARDNGVPLYNDLRVAYGLERVRTFAELSSDPTLAADLERIYGTIDKVDSWIGGLCEARRVGSLSALFAKIWEEEFVRLRNGDRFYFEKPNVFKYRHIRRIRTLRDLLWNRNAIGSVMRNLLLRNTDIGDANLPKNPFSVNPPAPEPRW